MNGRTASTVFVALWVAYTSGVAAAQGPGIARTSLVTVEPRDFRLGIGMAGHIPDKAHRLKLGNDTVSLWDLNGDGELTPDGGDGVSLDGLPFIVSLPGVLLLPSGQFRLMPHKGTSLTLERDLVAEPAAWIRAAATMTRVRIANGKRPLGLDKQASDECLLHCNYLRLNPPHVTGASPHDEDAKREGYTPGGAAGGRESCIWEVEVIDQSIEGNMATIWHSEPLMSPDVEAFGCAAAHGWSLVRALSGLRSTPFVHPADGAEDVPVEFAPGGEYPNPVAGTEFAQGCGHPVFAKLSADMGRLVGANLVDERGKDVTGTQSCPKAPANQEWPTNSGCAAFVPAAPLQAGTRFTATFAFDGGRLLSWQFRTRAAKGRSLEAWRYTPMPDAKPFDPGEFLGEGRRGVAEMGVDLTRVAPTARVLPSWVPGLRIGEVRVVQDPDQGWWCLQSRANDAGMISLHAFGRGDAAHSKALALAEQLRR